MKTKLFDKELFIYYKHCNDDANCNIKFSRSLYCKLYPFIPVFDIDGNLLDLKYISVYDVTYDIIGQKSPCYVKDLKAKYIDLWSKEDSNIHLLKNPYTLFYLMVGNLIHDNYVETLKSNNKLINLQGKEFWKKWEKLYLAGRQTIKDIFTANNIDISNIDENKSLIESGIIDSMTYVNILLEIEDSLNIEIDFENVDLASIVSINGLCNYINSL